MAKKFNLKKITEFLTKEKNIKYVVIVGLLAIGFIFFSEFNGAKGKDTTKTKQPQTTSDEYVEYIEQKVHKIVSSIKDVGDVDIMVTLESGKESVYAQEEKKNYDKTEQDSQSSGTKKQEKETSESSAIIVDQGSGNGKQALIEKELEPKIQGVVVVCQGGDDPEVRARVSEAITTALKISSARVCITVKQ